MSEEPTEARAAQKRFYHLEYKYKALAIASLPIMSPIFSNESLLQSTK